MLYEVKSQLTILSRECQREMREIRRLKKELISIDVATQLLQQTTMNLATKLELFRGEQEKQKKIENIRQLREHVWQLRQQAVKPHG